MYTQVGGKIDVLCMCKNKSKKQSWLSLDFKQIHIVQRNKKQIDTVINRFF